jgi:hypothetical protein
MVNETNKPNGPVAAALLAGGIGSAVLGLATLANEINSSSAFSKSLVWVKPVGGLSGKSSYAIIAFLLAWVILHFVWKGKEIKFSTISLVSYVLLAVGLIGTFPPVWHLLGG